MDANTLGRPLLSLSQRRTLATLALLVALIYLPLNRLMSGGVTVETPLDAYVPFSPIWIVPYLLSIGWWVVALAWGFGSLEDGPFLRFVTAWFVACGIGFSFFVFLPTYMVRPQVTGDDWASHLVRMVYAGDRTYNAFPSMHLWTTTLITLVMGRWRPPWRWPLWVLTAVVALSTVLSGQHWILDVFGGVALAFLADGLAPSILRLLYPARDLIEAG